LRRWYFLALAALPLVVIALQSPASPDLVWWPTHATEKIRPYDRAPRQSIQPVRIFAARNEFEPFQIVLRAQTGDMEAVDLEVSDLRGPSDVLTASRHIDVYLVRYVALDRPSSIDGGTGEWPDPLVPRVDRLAHEMRNAFPFTLVKGRNQPIWIETYVPPDTPPGSYEGQIHILVSGLRRATIPIELEVWNFELPSTSSLITTFGFNGVGALRQHFGKFTNDRDLYALTSLYRKSALRHRISVHGASGAPPAFAIRDGQVQLRWEKYDAEHEPFMDGLAFAPDEPLFGAKATALAVRTPPALKTPEHRIQYWRQVAQHFREKGWMERLFHYLWDEPQPEHYPAMIQLGEAVKQADPEIKNLVTAPLHPEWSRFVDIWTPVINCFERPQGWKRDYCEFTIPRSGYADEIANGKKLWWYQACGSHGCNIVGGSYFRGWPSYMIDHSGVRNRIMSWMSWKYGIGAELYFNMNQAYWKKDAWKDFHLFGGNGDGTLFYPGKPSIIGGTTDVPIESIRLKLIREGLEDYEYWALLAGRAGSEAASQFVGTFIRNIHDFDDSPEKLYAVREQIGRQLNRP
jgi:hypothetical protein